MLPGEAVLPRTRIFRYTEPSYGRRAKLRSLIFGSKKGSYAGFANLFRYKLLLEKGGWWVDLDTICLRPFDFPGEYVFSSEMHEGADVVDLGAVKVPAGAAIADYLFQESDRMPKKLYFGDNGPALMGRAVERFHMEQNVQPSRAFCPIACDDWESVLRPGEYPSLGPETFAVHFWNEMWRRDGRDKDATYPPDCLYERLKSKYLRA